MERAEQGRKYRLLIAEDHPTVRSGIRALLDHAPDVEVVGEAADGAQAVALAEELLPDLILLDLEMPVLHGAEVMRRVRASHPDVQVLVLTSHNDPEYVRGMLASGALGYLLKEDAPHLLLEAVRGIRDDRSHVWLSPQVELPATTPVWEQDLSGGELAILRSLAQGTSQEQMAVALGMSPKKFSTELGLLMMKFEAESVEALRDIARQMPPRW